ncbi:MAG: hypothetical protein JSS71_01620 [Armatimonadetes bacterium]|nr:hypothetical protein [Armatimonadota bacterium]
MRGTQVLAGLAMVGVIGILLAYPAGAKASPQLTMATGVGIAPQSNTGFMPGARRAIDTAKSDKKEADAKTKELNGLMDDEDKSKGPDLSNLPDKVYSAAELIVGVSSKGDTPFKGSLVKAEGVVVKTEPGNGFVTVFLGAPNANAKSPIFAFRVPGNPVFELGKVVSLEGKFEGRTRVEGIPVDVYVASSQGLSATPTSESTPKEPDAPFGGWKFVGSVESEEGATAVFVKEKEVLYAQPGDFLTDDVKLVKVKSGEATLRDKGQISTISPW